MKLKKKNNEEETLEVLEEPKEKKAKVKKEKKKKKLKLLTKLFILVDIIIVGCFVFVYGPNEYAKVTWITTAMTTSEFRFLANVFYDESTIKEVMNNNRMEEIDEETNIEDIVIGGKEQITTYTSIYEKEILEHDESKPYKLIKFKYKEFNAYIVAIYDPTRVKAAYNNPMGKGKIVSEIAANNNALVAINGGGYTWHNGKPLGIVVHDGKLVYSTNTNKYTTAVINKDGILIAGKMTAKEAMAKNAQEALSFGPVLIANGKESTFKGNGGSGQNPRTVIAQRQDGVILFLVVDGYPRGLTFKGRGGVFYQDLISILKKYGAYNAVNMDGGSSVTLVVEGKLINQPCEPQKNGQDFVRSAWILK